MSHTNHQPSTRASAPASAAELREFLARLKDKGPREVLGAIAQSHLGWALLQATVGCIALLAALTVGPYLIGKYSQAGENKAAAPEKEQGAPAAAKADPKTPEPAAPAGKTDVAPATVADTRTDEGKPSPAVVDKLKENETKVGAPKDPFSTNIDDLLNK